MAEAPTDRQASRAWSWLLGGAVAGWALIAFYLVHWGRRWALDLRVYRAAGASLYDHGAPYVSLFTRYRLPFTYPPFALIVLSPLSLGRVGLVMGLWWSANACALVAILYIAIAAVTQFSRRQALVIAAATGALAMIGLEPLRSNLDYGQINLLVMLLVVVDLTRIRGRWRGVLVGVAAAIKLTPLVYLAYFFVDRDRRSAYRGMATFAGVTALSWLILPSDSARYWFHEAFSPGRTGPVGSTRNQSWNGLVHRAPFHGGGLGMALWVSLSVATLVVGILGAKWLIALGRTIDAVLAFALTELLVSPISWTHHWSWLVLAGVVLVARWGEDRVLSVTLVAVLGVAIAEPYFWSVHGWVGRLLGDSLTLAGATLLVVLASGAKKTLRTPTNPVLLGRSGIDS
jgi:alpha-1,2-mannosyltransferase